MSSRWPRASLSRRKEDARDLQAALPAHVAAGRSDSAALWPDTFCNHFLPGTLKAAAIVLEDAGYRVLVPQAPLCCGRPLYDYGMLGLARRKLLGVLDCLRPAIRAGTPVVGVEPSCLSVFRDEMPNLLAGDPDAGRLATLTRTVTEQLLATPRWHPPRLDRNAVLHAHGHHKALFDAQAEQRVLRRWASSWRSHRQDAAATREPSDTRRSITRCPCR